MDLDIQPTLQNNSVLLRPLAKSDFASLYEIASDPLIWVQHPCNDRYKAAVFKIFFDDAIHSKGALIAIDSAKHKVIGSTRFKKISRADNAIEIGWSFLCRSYWGGYYNQQIKQLMFEYVFKTLDNVVFYIDRNNVRSQKAVEKLGGINISGELHNNLLSGDPNNLTFIINKTNRKF